MTYRVYTSLSKFILMMYHVHVHDHDTVFVVPPYPFCIEEDHISFPLEDCRYARPQLFFTCHLRPRDGRLPNLKNPSYRTGPDDLLFNILNPNHLDENQYTDTYWFHTRAISVQTSLTLPVDTRVCTIMKCRPKVYTGTYQYVLPCTFDQSIYWYKPVCTNSVYICTT
jgi:hypothetical protein